MDLLSSKRSSIVGLSKGKSNLSVRVPKNDNGGTQNCNKLVCSTRYNSNRGTDGSITEKPRKVKITSISKTKALNGSNNGSSSSSSNFRKLKQQKNVAPLDEKVSETSICRNKHINDSKSSIRCVDVVELESVRSVTRNILNSQEKVDIETQSLEECPVAHVSEHSKSHKQTNRQSVSSKSHNISSSTSRRSTTSQNPTRTARPSCIMPKNNLRNPSSSLVSGVPSASSSLNSVTSSGAKKRSQNEDISTSRGKGKINLSSRVSSDSPRTNAVANLNIVEPPLLEKVARKNNQTASRDVSSSSSANQRRVNRDSKRLSEPRIQAQESRRKNLVRETTITKSGKSSNREAITKRPSLSNGIGGRQVSNHGSRCTHTLHSPSADSRSTHQAEIDEIAQVLYAFDMFEQEHLSREQLFSLESSILFGAMGFHDQHRDMRLDIDNMSYEELLALGEKMGTVSTALTEDALSKCLKRSIFESVSMISECCNLSIDDIKCSICQEEYVEGDEVGNLCCDHRYHVNCIHQWLRQKNWCPICKASALPT